ncbi:MAG: FHA domain-containing protein [Planctomycetes bacterium]|nr:FHA domain-containing protein [Planctomycetota bacterium]
MAILVCCPCGNPLDCDRLDLIVTVGCPICSRELQIEVNDTVRGRFRALLTIMEGPHWVGEQFVLPIGQDLFIGRDIGNWLSLDSDAVSKRHCRLKLTQHGTVQVEDLESDGGTWIGHLRIAKGKLKPTESFKAGDFRMRLDYQSAIGGEIVSKKIEELDYSDILPELHAVDQSRGFAGRIDSQRFMIARQWIVAFAWLAAIYHVFALHAPPLGLEFYWGMVAGGGILAPLLFTGQRVALVHRYFKFAPIGVLVVLGLVDVVAWTLPMPAIGALVFGAALPLLTAQRPSPGRSVCGAFIGAAAVIYMGILAIFAVATHWGG